MTLKRFRNWLEQVLHQGRTGSVRRCAPARKLWLEALENRLAPASVQFGLASESLLETAGTFTIPVTLSAASSSAVSVPIALGGTAVAGTDFSGVTASPLVIPAGQLGATLTGTLLDDGGPDATKTLTLTLGAPTGASLGATITNTLTIAEQTASPTTLSIANATTVRPGPGGTTNLVFTATRTGDLSTQVTVGFTTVAGTAQPSTDFTPTTGTTTFAAGSATAQISIPILGSGVFTSPSVSFSVELTGVVNVVGPPVPFAGHSNFATGSRPIRVAVGDLNGDGKPDIVVADYAANTVSVLLNTTAPGATTPTFAPHVDFPTGTHPFGLALGDLNGDGKPDIVVSDFGDNMVSVLLNTTAPGATTPTFAAKQDFPTGAFPNGVAIGDLNGDGKPDIVVADQNAGTVSMLVNTTAPGATTLSFAPKADFSTGTQFGTGSIAVAIGDLNGDGKPDLAVANYGDATVSVLLNTTAPGAATPTFAAHQDFATGTKPNAVVIGDLNGDGRPDLAVSNGTASNVSVFLNTTAPGATTASFAPRADFAVGGQPGFGLALGDLDGDGKPDLITANAAANTISVLLNTTAPGAGTPAFAPHQDVATGSSPTAAALGDFNGDGLLDVVTSNQAGPNVSVLLNTTVLAAATLAPALPQAATLPAGSAPVSVAVGDLNGDGKPDLVVTNENDKTVSVFLNTTAPGANAPTFGAPQTFATGTSPFAVKLGDLNGDGKPDIVVANLGDNTVSVLFNTTAPGATTASFAAQQTFATGTEPDAVALADVNSDGKLDIVAANLTDGTISVLLNTTAAGAAAPTFAAQQTFAVGSSPVGLTIADLNGDGKPDVVVTNENDATVSVLVNTTVPGAAVVAFAAAQAFGTGANPDAVAVGDVNGDGLPDLIVANGNDDTVSVLLNTTAPGAAVLSFTTQKTFATGTLPDAVAVIDVNGDGKPDIVVANGTDNTISELLNTTVPGAATPSFATQVVSATGLLPHALALGDFNNDGRPDVAAVNMTDNTLSVLPNTPVEALGSLATGTITETKPPAPPPSSTGSQTPSSNSQVATTVAVQVSLNPAVPGQLVGYTVTVQASGGSGSPSGSVTLTGLPGGAVTLTLQDGSATFRAAAPLGRFVVTASYSGDTNFVASQSSAVTEVVQLLALQPGTRRNIHSLVIGTTAGKDLITVAKHGKHLIVTLRQVTHGHLHAHQVVLAAGVTRIIVVGQRSLDQVVLSKGLKLPVTFVKPLASVTKHR